MGTGAEDEESMDKIKEIQMCIEDSKAQVAKAIDKTIERGDKLGDLEDKAEGLRDDADLFNRQARTVRRRFWCQNCRQNMLLITAGIILAIIIYFVFIHPLVTK